MKWQDFVIACGSIIFDLALLRMLFAPEKPPLSSSILTGGTLLVFAVTYATLGLWFAFATTVAGGAFWLLLAWQRYLQHKLKSATLHEFPNSGD